MSQAPQTPPRSYSTHEPSKKSLLLCVHALNGNSLCFSTHNGYSPPEVSRVSIRRCAFAHRFVLRGRSWHPTAHSSSTTSPTRPRPNNKHSGSNCFSHGDSASWDTPFALVLTVIIADGAAMNRHPRGVFHTTSAGVVTGSFVNDAPAGVAPRMRIIFGDWMPFEPRHLTPCRFHKNPIDIGLRLQSPGDARSNL